LFFLSSTFFSCKKEEKTYAPTVVTASADKIFSTTTRVGGKIIDNRGEEISECGIYRSTQPEVELSGSKITVETETDIFTIHSQV